MSDICSGLAMKVVRGPKRCAKAREQVLSSYGLAVGESRIVDFGIRGKRVFSGVLWIAAIRPAIPRQ